MLSLKANGSLLAAGQIGLLSFDYTWVAIMHSISKYGCQPLFTILLAIFGSSE